MNKASPALSVTAIATGAQSTVVPIDNEPPASLVGAMRAFTLPGSCAPMSKRVVKDDEFEESNHLLSR
jgi:hypothetical protein